MGARRKRRDRRQFDMKLSRRVNGALKNDERVRREKRMHEILQNHKFPYTPSIMSWLSVKLDKPSTKIVEADVKQLLAAK
ncbi:MAG: hypothetical protein U0840_12100 [Gemmataceae bacterium]